MTYKKWKNLDIQGSATVEYDQMHGLEKLVVENKTFNLPWLKLGDQMVFERGSPSVGNFTILKYGGMLQPVWPLGVSLSCLNIVCKGSFEYPEAVELPIHIDFEWVMSKNS